MNPFSMLDPTSGGSSGFGWSGMGSMGGYPSSGGNPFGFSSNPFGGYSSGGYSPFSNPFAGQGGYSFPSFGGFGGFGSSGGFGGYSGGYSGGFPSFGGSSGGFGGFPSFGGSQGFSSPQFSYQGSQTPAQPSRGFSGPPGGNQGYSQQGAPGGFYAQIVPGGIMGAPDHDSSFSDWFAPQGTSVKSPVSGTVVQSGQGFFGGVGLAIRGDDGGLWEFRHGNGRVQPGQRVSAGQDVFVIGDSSLPPGWQHVDIRLNGQGATQFLRQRGAQAQSMPTGGPSQGMGFLSQPGPLAGQGGGQYGGFGGGGMNPFGMGGGNPFGGGMGSMMGGMGGPMGMMGGMGMMPPMMGGMMGGMGGMGGMGMGMPPMMGGMGMNPFGMGGMNPFMGGMGGMMPFGMMGM